MKLMVQNGRCADRFAWLLPLALLAACATPPGPPPNLVLDAISREIGAASHAPESHRPPPAVQAALLPPLIGESGRSGEARFDISVQNAPAEQVFMAIVNGTPYNMLPEPGVSGQITLSLKNVTVREVLDTIRDLYGYDYRVQGDRIFVQPNTLQTRVFKVNYLAARRQGTTQVNLTSSTISGGSASTGGAPGSSASPTAAAPNTANAASLGAQVQTALNLDFWRELQQSLNALVSNADGRSVVLNPSSGVILVRALPNELRQVEGYLKTTQLAVERQVMLEAKIIEVSLNEQYQAGVNWANFGKLRPNIVGNTPNQALGGGLGANSTLSASGLLGTSGKVAIDLATAGAAAVATGSDAGFYGLAFQSANFAAMLSFLETQGTVHVLSSPRVATLNNQKAVLKVGTDEFHIVNITFPTQNQTQGQSTTNTTPPSFTTQSFFSGIALDVTPQIDDSEQIILHVHPSITQVKDKPKPVLLEDKNYILPLASSEVNESDSVVRVRDGQIVAIGGLMTQEQRGDRSGLPGTGAGEFFLLGQRDRTLRKKELVILIKPTIIREESDWRNTLTDTPNRLQEYAPTSPVTIFGGR